MPDIKSTGRRIGRRPILAITAAALVAVGGGAGALAVSASRPTVTMAPATPVAIRSLTSDSGDVVTVRGRVAEIFGNHFVMADASGRALVDLGREGENGTLVAAGEPVTVQGRFDHGSIRAAFLVKADGKVTALGPLGGPHGGHDGPRGPRPGDRGPDDRGPDDRGPDDRGPGDRGPGDRGPGDDRADRPTPPPAAAGTGASTGAVSIPATSPTN